MRSGVREGWYQLHVETPEADERIRAPHPELPGYHQATIYTHADLLLRYVRELEEFCEREWKVPVKIYAETGSSLNRGPEYPLIRPDVDLTEYEFRPFGHHDFFTDLEAMRREEEKAGR